MPFQIVRNDITKMQVDAIVNPTNKNMYGTGGVDGAIHKTAGPLLRQATAKLPQLKAGEAVMTSAYNMKVDFIIHTLGPLWQGGNDGEDAILRNCYENALKLALENNLVSIALPLIASGTHTYPKDRALSVAIAAIGGFLLKHEMMVYLVVYDKKAYKLSEKLFLSIETYIDDNYVEDHKQSRTYSRREYLKSSDEPMAASTVNLATCKEMAYIKPSQLEDLVKTMDDTFSEMLLRLIDKSGLKDPEVYKKANVTKQTFSKIRNNKTYNPTKATALAFAIALELNLDDSKDLLKRAGFAFSSSNLFDVIIRFFIENKNYNIFEINEALFLYDENLLGL